MPEQQIHDIKKKVDDIHGFIFGNAEQPNSVHVRLDRIEQAQKNRKWYMNIIAIAVGGLGLEKIVEILKNHL